MNKHKGTLIDFRLKLWGESIDADKATLLPLAEDDDDDDHDKEETDTISASQVSTAPAPTATEVKSDMEKPTDHPERPTKPAAKPSDAKPSDAKPSDEPTSTSADDDTSTAVAQEPTESPSNSNWVSWLPSFGASKTVQVWIYGAIGLIVVFCVGLGAWWFVARRRRLRNDPRTSYEFEMLNEDEGAGLAAGQEKTTTGRRGRRTRGGELYDAFAGGSDDESDEDSEDEYRDRQQAQLNGDDEDQYVVGGESDDESDASVNEKAGR